MPFHFSHRLETTRRFLPLVLLASLLALTGCSQGEVSWDDHMQGLPFVVGYENGMRQAREDNKPALVFVTTTWCGWCKKLAADNFNDEQIRQLMQKFTLVLVDGDREQTAAHALGAAGYPMIVFLDRDGKTIVHSPGYKKPAEFRVILNHVLADVEKADAKAKQAEEKPAGTKT